MDCALWIVTVHCKRSTTVDGVAHLDPWCVPADGVTPSHAARSARHGDPVRSVVWSDSLGQTSTSRCTLASLSHTCVSAEASTPTTYQKSRLHHIMANVLVRQSLLWTWQVSHFRSDGERSSDRTQRGPRRMPGKERGSRLLTTQEQSGPDISSFHARRWRKRRLDVMDALQTSVHGESSGQASRPRTEVDVEHTLAHLANL